MNLDDLNTGDLILFQGKGYWFSYLVELFTWSKYSHIGMVLKDPVYIDPSLKGLYLWESGKEDVEDAVDHVKKFGVQIIPLEDKIKNYDGHIFYRKLNPEKPIDIQKLLDIRKIVHNKKYDDHILDLICADLKINKPQQTDDFFCSALVAYIYDRLGYLDVNYDIQSPNDFSKKDLVLNGATLGDVTKIV